MIKLNFISQPKWKPFHRRLQLLYLGLNDLYHYILLGYCLFFCNKRLFNIFYIVWNSNVRTHSSIHRFPHLSFNQCSTSIPPENIRNLRFLMFSKGIDRGRALVENGLKTVLQNHMIGFYLMGTLLLKELWFTLTIKETSSKYYQKKELKGILHLSQCCIFFVILWNLTRLHRKIV